MNPAYYVDDRVLDPQRPETLVYAPAAGRQVLIGAMFLDHDPDSESPQPGGCATVWHDHQGVCVRPGSLDLPNPQSECADCTTSEQTASMLHVWTIDTPAGPFAHELDPAAVREGVVAKIPGG